MGTFSLFTPYNLSLLSQNTLYNLSRNSLQSLKKLSKYPLYSHFFLLSLPLIPLFILSQNTPNSQSPRNKFTKVLVLFCPLLT